MSSVELESLMADLRRTTNSLQETHSRMMSMTGSAWSRDGNVKVEVGPRGQVIDVEIDPKVFRRPDVTVLRSAVLEASNAAVADIVGQVNEIIQGQIPAETDELRRRLRPEEPTLVDSLLRTDSQVIADRELKSHGW